MKIEVRKPADDELRSLGVFSWPTCRARCRGSIGATATRRLCYLLEGG